MSSTVNHHDERELRVKKGAKYWRSEDQHPKSKVAKESEVFTINGPLPAPPPIREAELLIQTRAQRFPVGAVANNASRRNASKSIVNKPSTLAEVLTGATQKTQGAVEGEVIYQNQACLRTVAGQYFFLCLQSW